MHKERYLDEVKNILMEHTKYVIETLNDKIDKIEVAQDTKDRIISGREELKRNISDLKRALEISVDGFEPESIAYIAITEKMNRKIGEYEKLLKENESEYLSLLKVDEEVQSLINEVEGIQDIYDEVMSNLCNLETAYTEDYGNLKCDIAIRIGEVKINAESVDEALITLLDIVKNSGYNLSDLVGRGYTEHIIFNSIDEEDKAKFKYAYDVYILRPKNIADIANRVYQVCNQIGITDVDVTVKKKIYN